MLCMSNAAIVRNQLVQHMTDDDWDGVFDVNLRAVFRGLRAAAVIARLNADLHKGLASKEPGG